jgi:ABC-2 type transport system permease protein
MSTNPNTILHTSNKFKLTAPTAPPTAIGVALAYAWRTIRQYIRTPQLLVVNAVTSTMFLLVFRYVFGGAITTKGIPYANFLIPGLAALSGLFAGGVIGVAEDTESGFFDRLRSLPVPRWAVMLGRSLADTVLITWGTLITVLVGFGVGFRPSGGLGGFAAAMGLCILFASSVSWISIFLGLIAGTAQAAQGMQFAVFPLIFVSSAYVPVASMPAALRPFAENQPATAMVDSVRALVIGGDTQALFGESTGRLVMKAIFWSIVITLVFSGLAIRNFTRR